MGWVGNSAQKVRGFQAAQPEVKAKKVAKGVPTASAMLGGRHITGHGGAYGELQPILEIEGDLHRRYVDYENMDDYPELSTALDIYADDTTQPDWLRGCSMWVESSNNFLKAELTQLYHGRLDIEEDLWPNVRTLCKYGNANAEILLSNQGVVGLNYLPPASMRRMITRRGADLGYIQDADMRFESRGELLSILQNAPGKLKDLQKRNETGRENIALFEPWEMVHWRLRMKHMHSIYGHSVLEPARWVWRRLALLEDAVMVYRLTRSPERFAFMVDVGKMPKNEALNYVNSVRAQYRKKRFYNPAKGGLDMRYNPLSHSDDFWIPSREGRDSTRIETVGGLQYQSMDDIEYFRKKLGAAIKIPPVHLGGDAQPVSNHLSHTDVRFARTILRIQRETINGYKQVGRVHLVAVGRDRVRNDAWSLKMSTPTLIYELAVMEALATKNTIARDMREQVSLEWVLTNIYKFSEDEAAQILVQKRQEMIAQATWEAEAEVAGEKVKIKELPQEVREQMMERASKTEKADTSELERLMQAGSRQGERRLKERLDELLEGQSELAAHYKKSEGMMADIRQAIAAK